jgi:hypothetical protein
MQLWDFVLESDCTGNIATLAMATSELCVQRPDRYQTIMMRKPGVHLLQNRAHPEFRPVDFETNATAARRNAAVHVRIRLPPDDDRAAAPSSGVCTAWHAGALGAFNF